jgi:hypothetical protein
MRHPARLGAFLSGAALYSVAVMLGGSLADRGLPAGLAAQLGQPESLQQLFGESLLVAMPIFLMALAWSYVTVRPYRRGRRPPTAWCLGGLAMAWLGWLFYGAAYAAAEGLNGPDTWMALLLSPRQPPLWGLLNALAVLLGVLLAGVLARRHALLQPAASAPSAARRMA